MSYTISVMSYDFKSTKEGLAKAHDWLQRELATVRTGRAATALLDQIHIESYGVKSPLSHVASIGIDDPKTVRVTPWDKAHLGAIESAISAANLGVSAVADGGSVRVSFPDVTADRRIMLVKLVREKLEEAKVTLRGEREKAWSEIQKHEKEGALSEDEKFRAKDELQKLIDEAQKQFVLLADKKQLEIEN